MFESTPDIIAISKRFFVDRLPIYCSISLDSGELSNDPINIKTQKKE